MSIFGSNYLGETNNQFPLIENKWTQHGNTRNLDVQCTQFPYLKEKISTKLC